MVPKQPDQGSRGVWGSNIPCSGQGGICPPTETWGDAGAAPASVALGFQWGWAATAAQSCLGSFCLPAAAGTVLRSHRGRIQPGCWRLLILQESQSSQGSQWGGGRGDTWTTGTPAWAWGSPGLLQRTGRSLEEQSSLKSVILQPKIMPLKASQCQLPFYMLMSCPAHLWCRRNNNSCTLG